ncbi:hypothetical protein BDN72DRAFT_899178 [Pluteus cervinus]|uniref:Uncharacterized protein n=1 Tax=Pluteus cervinus TaxID=181527 RepID=A0ACD3AN07_9AGAR|nr:hypothetical protein BDN72DRAFT_899178 [Pluteus cervinus]
MNNPPDQYHTLHNTTNGVDIENSTSQTPVMTPGVQTGITPGPSINTPPGEPIFLPEPKAPPKEIRRWLSGDPPKFPLPKSADSSGWQECYKYVNEYDEDMCESWKDEIDKLLIFASRCWQAHA